MVPGVIAVTTAASTSIAAAPASFAFIATASVAATSVATATVASSSIVTAGLFGWGTGREPLTTAHGLGMLLAVVGVALIVSRGLGLRGPRAATT